MSVNIDDHEKLGGADCGLVDVGKVLLVFSFGKRGFEGGGLAYRSSHSSMSSHDDFEIEDCCSAVV